MSDEKREQLIADGALNADGSRVHRCPACAQVVDEATWAERFTDVHIDITRADAVVEPPPVSVAAEVPGTES